MLTTLLVQFGGCAPLTASRSAARHTKAKLSSVVDEQSYSGNIAEPPVDHVNRSPPTTATLPGTVLPGTVLPGTVLPGTVDADADASSIAMASWDDAPDADEGLGAAGHAGPYATTAFTIAEVIDHARARHPIAIASSREVTKAEAGVRVAGDRQNPEFVLDVDTPVHDDNDPTELSTRLTFPIGQSQRRADRMRVARAELMAAIARHDASIRRLSEQALSAAIEMAYFQEKLALSEEIQRLSEEKLLYLAPEERDGDAAGNLVNYANANRDASQARSNFIETQRDLVLARISLAESMGIDLSTSSTLVDTLSIDETLRAPSFELPSLQAVIDSALADSAEIAAAQAVTETGWEKYRAIKNEPHMMETGPRYQDRLGRNDDSIGVRFQTDLPIYDTSTNPISVAGIAATELEDQVRLARHQIAAQAARDYSELRFLASKMADNEADRFIEQQQAILDSEDAQSEMTGDQVVAIQLAIVDRQMDRLDTEYRFASLRSKLRLHAAY